MKISIIGAGVMGLNTALVCAVYGHEVVILDKNKDIAAQIPSLLKNEFRYYRMLESAFKTVSQETVSSRVMVANTYSAIEGSDWVIENVKEDLTAKQDVYQQLSMVIDEKTLVAANTSCISITKIGSCLPYPAQVIGMHFMNPVALKKCVEVIKGFHTSDETVVAAQALLRSLNKNAVIVDDYPGFVSNRLSHLFMNEAAFLVQDKVASPKDIDKIFKEGYGHAMGPLETADLIGLDTVVNSLNVLYESYQDPKYRCCPLLKKMVDAGLLGKKSAHGFFKY
ncbi:MULTISPECIES: 3-hydroxyacyl-CoA dehydrogenase family protein [Pectobacterium]|uniref:3-hydroxybutyryl-CoA dehydrogenase n=1 Tax=Pectobacterium odoriferum TaxID=78398 RepID=A0ABD6VJP2_9GAMM|nr:MULTISPECIES: 3-hydroxyacyl-CoA dehydrogenase family protein [Pectobacterium]AIU89024.1 3-hydroxybutyryl-CoA dehydrogenase [Pectobacterium odoriferum]KGA31087.1 3-hydroxybutyryl-CoA dehydrogenase [Pectobacterium odoriferum]KGA39749.1 3-hydroxybutyryl-CoA dehydrogenase [Pectobacterium odoriferum]MBA0187158.1 3-hydroxyacyl-CoA dehydrogenase family protein [Pectobacterium odoriferum]MCA6962969.1 3-hydroxyacyl-CoA dehydrogenase family protein [Pectobacterium odoriferum]